MNDDTKPAPKPNANAFASLVGRTMKTGSTLPGSTGGGGDHDRGQFGRDRGYRGSRNDQRDYPPAAPPAQLTPGPFYTGTGSKTAPPSILTTLREVAASLESNGWYLRSGGAPGADDAFEKGVADLAHAEIYIPWTDFEGRKHGIRPGRMRWEEAKAMASTIHPVFDRLKPSEQSQHTRNVFEVCGTDLKDQSRFSSFVLCWTQDGAETAQDTGLATGGTRTAIVLAANLSIPVINFAREGAMQRFHELLDGFPALRTDSTPRP